MTLKVICLTHYQQHRYRDIATAMATGIKACGDVPIIREISSTPRTEGIDCAVAYGWKRRHVFQQYPRFIYADLGYWHRESYYRLSINGWSPDGYVSAGLSSDRLSSFGVTIKPWRSSGDEIVIAGSTAKSCAEHGYSYMHWERQAAEDLKDCGKRIVYRPKPRDRWARPIEGIGYDTRPIAEALQSAWAWVTHHSNSAIDALTAGVPVHCETGAAAAFSVPMDQMADPPLLEGREQFLADVAWLQWTLDEIRSGKAWAHMKERGLLC